MRKTHKENNSIIQYFQVLVDQERAYAQTIQKRAKLWGDVKANYNEKAWSFGSLLSGIEDFEIDKSKEKIQYSEMLKKSVNETVS